MLVAISCCLCGFGSGLFTAGGVAAIANLPDQPTAIAVAQEPYPTFTPYPTYTAYPTQQLPKPKPTKAPAQPPAPEQPVAEPPTPAPPPVEPQNVVHSVGEPIPFDGYSLTLQSVAFENGVLMITIAIANTGADAINVSSMIGYTARNAAGELRQQKYIDCTDRRISGAVAPGEQIVGDICFEVPAPEPIRLYYQDNLFDGKITIWQLNP